MKDIYLIRKMIVIRIMPLERTRAEMKAQKIVMGSFMFWLFRRRMGYLSGIETSCSIIQQ